MEDLQTQLYSPRPRIVCVVPILVKTIKQHQTPMQKQVESNSSGEGVRRW